MAEFSKHITAEHILDDKSTAQARVQMQIVSQLELQLQKERERLQAMMSHLHLNKKQEEEKERMKSEQGGRENGYPRTPEPEISKPLAGLPKPLAFGPPAMPGLSFPPSLGGLGGFPGPRPPGFSFLPPGPNQGMPGPIRRRITDKAPMSLPSGFPYMFDRTGLDIAQELNRNREFYRTHDVRPPFTYVDMIRQSVMEVPDKQLTLHGIYDWFTSTFAYFRRNLKSWKVRNIFLPFQL
jgi:forkhead box protein P